MSALPNSYTFLAHAITNDTYEREGFSKFFDSWLSEQDQYLQELISVSKRYNQNADPNSTTTSTAESSTHDQVVHEPVLCPLINRVIQHYEHYYGAKSTWAKQDVLAILSPSWLSSLEDAFSWIGGWRPSMAFHLLYSKSGLQLEENLADLIRGLGTGDLGDLSASQLNLVDALQRRTLMEERELTEGLAKHQETVADSSMVELSHEVTELLREREAGGDGTRLDEDRVDSALAPKEEGLADILQTADDLRLRTLKGILDVLTPIQAVHFLIAAAGLQLRLHNWGKERDEKARQHHGSNGSDDHPHS
ncbi:hypothetical protein I3760_03G108500 [Carya illinoinensis]|nr:hypothetical protein I3760_03G108500 [Carya illinoinensis]